MIDTSSDTKRYGKVETLASFNSRESFRLLLMLALGSVSLCSHLLLFKTIQDVTECHSPVLRSKRKVFTWYFQNKCLHNPVIALHSLTLNSFCHCSALLLPMPSHGQRTANPREVCYWFCALIFTGDNPFLPPWYYTHWTLHAVRSVPFLSTHLFWDQVDVFSEALNHQCHLCNHLYRYKGHPRWV